MYFIIEDLLNPIDYEVFKILCGSTQIDLDAVTLDEPGVVITSELISQDAATVRKYPYQKIEYVNIAPWTLEKIEARVARIGLKM